MQLYASLHRLRTRNNTGCFKKRFTTSKAYINLFRGHVQQIKAMEFVSRAGEGH
jgi:hypothetical protein